MENESGDMQDEIEDVWLRGIGPIWESMDYLDERLGKLEKAFDSSSSVEREVIEEIIELLYHTRGMVVGLLGVQVLLMRHLDHVRTGHYMADFQREMAKRRERLAELPEEHGKLPRRKLMREGTLKVLDTISATNLD